MEFISIDAVFFNAAQRKTHIRRFSKKAEPPTYMYSCIVLGTRVVHWKGKAPQALTHARLNKQLSNILYSATPSVVGTPDATKCVPIISEVSGFWGKFFMVLSVTKALRHCPD